MKSQATLFLLGIFLAQGCQTNGVVPISKRGIGGFDKPGSSYMHGRSPGRDPKPDLYIGNKVVKVEPKSADNTTGSLFVMDDQRNYLYASKAPFAVDQYIDVKVVSAQSKQKDEANPSNGEVPADASGDEVVKELLDGLPKLDPGPDGTKPLQMLKMKIAQVFENGDALVIFKRNSKNQIEGREVAVRARIPYSALIADHEITTKDLVDVHWMDTLDGELTERYSSAWEDEYTLRMSGFTEAKSLYAQQLEDKRIQMESVRAKVRNQLVSIGKERAKLSEERQKWQAEKAAAEAKVEELEAQLKRQEEQQQNQLAEPEQPAEVEENTNGE